MYIYMYTVHITYTYRRKAEGRRNKADGREAGRLGGREEKMSFDIISAPRHLTRETWSF